MLFLTGYAFRPLCRPSSLENGAWHGCSRERTRRDRSGARRMKTTLHSAVLALVVVLAGHACAQTANGPNPSDAVANPWSFSLAASGYLIPHDQSYGSPTFTADHSWLHLEARYNYEYQKTGSLWAGYNFSVGHKLVLDATPMFGVVFGSTTGLRQATNSCSPTGGLNSPLRVSTYLTRTIGIPIFSIPGTNWSTCLSDWFHAGLVAQRTRAYHTDLDVQRGFSVGVAHKKVDFTTYIFNAGWTDPTVVLALSVKF